MKKYKDKRRCTETSHRIRKENNDNYCAICGVKL